MTPTHRSGGERLIGALVLTALPGRPRPRPAPMSALPAPHLPAGVSPVDLLLGMARPDPSGRLTERHLLRALRWGPGHRLDLDVQAGGLLLTSAAAGSHRVGPRGELHLPGGARRMCGIDPGQPLLLAAMVAHDLLMIHPASWHDCSPNSTSS
ncbi:hypothetical protein OG799_15860 [Micromonospora sp. NBC_00898]|uniref:hypothetical protein n=1 Tax=Micromonospora sp. NBC_00898 TaxID=2975981 RepID=UPI00386C69F6|nr:hypothetical protein OG799_15860 [Micromonospora sp. NBC_00898]